MGSILAIEADPKRRGLLTSLIREHVKSDITFVESVKAAIASLADHVPDLIVAPTLLSPRDSEELNSHVKQLHAAPFVQMLTIPALDMLVEPPKEEQRGLQIFKRRPVSLELQYDPEMVGALILDRLERAEALRAEHDAALAMPVQAESELALAVRASRNSAAAELASSGNGPLHGVADERRCAHRIGQTEVPWLSVVRLPWGVDVDLVNISRTGLLVESGSKLATGITLKLHLSGPDTNLFVLARFVRSEVARINRNGVRYYAAAQFETPLEYLAPRHEPVKRSSTPQALAELLATVLAESDHSEPVQIRLARGFRALVRARDVLIRHAPVAPVDDSESIYFHVKGDGRSRVILQVMFEPDRALNASEFRLLKAAALLTAAVLELEDDCPDRRSVIDLPRPVGKTSLAKPRSLTAA